jgi:hypothetical protein
MMAREWEDDQMPDMLLVAGRADGPRYADIANPADVVTLLEPVPQPAPAGTTYRRLGALGDTASPAPILYTVELDIAPEHLAEIFRWYEEEHFPMLTAVPGCRGGLRYQRAEPGPFNLLAAYRFEHPEVNQSPAWIAARSTEWTARVRPLFRDQRRFVRRLEA